MTKKDRVVRVEVDLPEEYKQLWGRYTVWCFIAAGAGVLFAVLGIIIILLIGWANRGHP